MVGSIEITFLVKPNFKLERLILGFGEAVTILRPEKLSQRIGEKLQHVSNRYWHEVPRGYFL